MRTLIVSLSFVAACGATQKTGPIPGEDPVVGAWRNESVGTVTLESGGVLKPDPRFANRCADDPRVRAEKERCAKGQWAANGNGTYAIVVPNFVQASPDGNGANDCKCGEPLAVLGKLEGNSLSLGRAVFTRR